MSTGDCDKSLHKGYLGGNGRPRSSRIALKRMGLLSGKEKGDPAGIRAIAGLFALCSAYLTSAGLAMLISPGAISMSVGAPLLFGLELAGPYMFLLVAAIGAVIAWGLFKFSNTARRFAVLTALAGVVMLVPIVSAATIMVEPKMLALGGLGIIVRVVIAWYLWREDVVEQFSQRS